MGAHPKVEVPRSGNEFQRVKIAGRDKQTHRIGRVSVIDEDGVVVYDVFAFYPELPGHTKTLSARWRRLGVYWEDIQIENGAVPIEEVERNLRAMFEGHIIIGHAIENDIKVCSPFVWEGIEIRNTQKHKYYQQLLGTRQPGLARLAPYVVGHSIQGKEHCSCEDGRPTFALWKHRREAIEEEQAGWVHRGTVDEEDLDFGDEDDEDTYYDDQENGAIREDLAACVAELAKMPVTASTSFWQAGAAKAKQTQTASYNIKSTTPKVAPPRYATTSTVRPVTKLNVATTLTAQPIPSHAREESDSTATTNQSPSIFSRNSSLATVSSLNTTLPDPLSAKKITYASVVEKKPFAAPAVPEPTSDAKPLLRLVQKTVPTTSDAKNKKEVIRTEDVAGETWRKFTAAQKTQDTEVATPAVAKATGKKVFKLKG